MTDDVLRAELAAFRVRSGKAALRVLQTGCVRRGREEGCSSLVLAREAREHGGTLTGIGPDAGPAVGLLAARRLDGTFHQGMPLEVMPRLMNGGQVFDVIFLDCWSAPGLVMQEFFLAVRMLDRPGLLLADDMDRNDPGSVKGNKLIPYLVAGKYDFRIVRQDILVMDME